MNPTNNTRFSVYQIPQFLVFTALLLYWGKAFFIPICFAILFSFILYPISKSLENKGLGRAFSITLSFLLIAFITTSITALVIYQISQIAEKIPILIDKLLILFNQIQEWLASELSISLEQQMDWLKKAMEEFAQFLGTSLKNTLNLTIDFLIFIVIVPFLTVLIIYQREKFVTFLHDILPEKHHVNIKPILHESIHTFHGYIKGLFWVYVIVAILNSLGLWLLGLENAIFYGILTAFLTIIPYFGIILGAILPITEAWMMYNSLWYPLAVIGIFMIVQYIEANLIFPLAVGQQLRINTFATLMALLLGGVIWGTAGLVIFLPFTAIFKLIADKTDSLKPFGKLLGEDASQKNSKKKFGWLEKLRKREVK
jgi:predicted PurR-regulated permease PerM